MREMKKDAFFDFAEQYDTDREHHLIGEVDYYLLIDEKPYEGLRSHREALRFVFDCLLRPWVYDIDQAQALPLDYRVFFYCPKIIRTDYYGNAWYDAEWRPNDENCGTTVPYWYALMEPVHGRRNKPEDFKRANEVLFPKGTDALDIYEWTTDWSDYFDAGHEWYGACCWSVYDQALNRYVVMLVSATD